MHIAPGTDFGKPVDIIIGNIHASRISHLSVNHHNFLMVTTKYVIDIRKTNGTETGHFHSSFRQHLQMFLSQGTTVRQISKVIKQGLDCHSFFGFLGQQGKQFLGNRITAEIKVFQMDIVFSLLYIFKQMFKLAATALQQSHTITRRNRNLFFFQKTGKQGISRQVNIGCVRFSLSNNFFQALSFG